MARSAKRGSRSQPAKRSSAVAKRSSAVAKRSSAVAKRASAAGRRTASVQSHKRAHIRTFKLKRGMRLEKAVKGKA